MSRLGPIDHVGGRDLGCCEFRDGVVIGLGAALERGRRAACMRAHMCAGLPAASRTSRGLGSVDARDVLRDGVPQTGNTGMSRGHSLRGTGRDREGPGPGATKGIFPWATNQKNRCRTEALWRAGRRPSRVWAQKPPTDHMPPSKRPSSPRQARPSSPRQARPTSAPGPKKNGGTTPVKKAGGGPPNWTACEFCGQKFSATSLPIHQKQCKARPDMLEEAAAIAELAKLEGPRPLDPVADWEQCPNCGERYGEFAIGPHMQRCKRLLPYGKIKDGKQYGSGRPARKEVVASEAFDDFGSGLSAEELETLRALFAKYDTDGNEALDEAELGALLTECFPARATDLERLLAEFRVAVRARWDGTQMALACWPPSAAGGDRGGTGDRGHRCSGRRDRGGERPPPRLTGSRSMVSPA